VIYECKKCEDTKIMVDKKKRSYPCPICLSELYNVIKSQEEFVISMIQRLTNEVQFDYEEKGAISYTVCPYCRTRTKEGLSAKETEHRPDCIWKKANDFLDIYEE